MSITAAYVFQTEEEDFAKRFFLNRVSKGLWKKVKPHQKKKFKQLYEKIREIIMERENEEPGIDSPPPEARTPPRPHSPIGLDREATPFEPYKPFFEETIYPQRPPTPVLDMITIEGLVIEVIDHVPLEPCVGEEDFLEYRIHLPIDGLIIGFWYEADDTKNWVLFF